MWFLDQLEPHSAAYTIATAVQLDGALDQAALAASVTTLVARHESLRTHVAVHDGQPVQVITPAAPVPLPVVDLRALSAASREATARQLAAEEARQPFDLTQGPLLRMRLLQLDAEVHLLLLTLHHLIADGWSLALLLRELATLYTACRTDQPAALPELPVQYADYAV